MDKTDDLFNRKKPSKIELLGLRSKFEQSKRAKNLDLTILGELAIGLFQNIDESIQMITYTQRGYIFIKGRHENLTPDSTGGFPTLFEITDVVFPDGPDSNISIYYRYPSTLRTNWEETVENIQTLLETESLTVEEVLESI